MLGEKEKNGIVPRTNVEWSKASRNLGEAIGRISYLYFSLFNKLFIGYLDCYQYLNILSIFSFYLSNYTHFLMFNFLSLHWCFHHLPWRETIKWKDSRRSLMVSTQPWNRWCEVRIHGKEEMIINSHWKFTYISEWVRVQTQIIIFNITISTFLLVELRFVDYTLFFF